MATTTNFGWETPDDTDLVKDGAAAIRTALGGVDTSFVDLKGGTTGQVLSKASNTDLDFSWIAVDPLTILDAKGDLISATAADTPARLAVGANNTVLTADSSTATGLKWATPASPSYAWTTWTPTLTAITQGNGTVTARYVQIDKTVTAQFKFVLGTTSAITGAIEITLPVTAANTNYIGNGLLIDGGASFYVANVIPQSTTKIGLMAAYASPYVFSLNTSSTVPFTWASTDTVQVSLTYEAA